MMAPDVKAAIPLDPYVVRVVFADGEVRDVDIEPLLLRSRLRGAARSSHLRLSRRRRVGRHDYLAKRRGSRSRRDLRDGSSRMGVAGPRFRSRASIDRIVPWFAGSNDARAGLQRRLVPRPATSARARREVLDDRLAATTGQRG